MDRVIQLTRQGTHVKAGPEELADLANAFSRQHHLRLPSLIEPSLIDKVSRELEQARFRKRTYRGVGVEQKLSNTRITGLLNFLANNQTLFQTIQTVTNCGAIGCFLGRVYRMAPTKEHYDLWHDDVLGNRLIAMSINLSPDEYSGGVLQLRESVSKKIIAEVPNTGFGDGVIFRIADFLEHRITDVVGTAPKMAFAGWFKSKPDFLATIRKDEQRLDAHPNPGLGPDRGRAKSFLPICG